MDIANYIGLFLLKNKYCYIHGIGNLELLKRPATNDGKTLSPASYEVVVTPNGSIDDNFANFIATNEQISISKAANELRDFSTQAKKDLAEGKEVVVDNIGKFVQQEGKIKFITDERFSFKPTGIPIVPNSKKLEEQKEKTLPNIPLYPAPKNADSINWTMVILVVVLLIVLSGGGYGIYYYTNQQKNNTPEVKPVIKDTVIKPQPIATLTAVDTTKLLKDSIAAQQTPTVSSAVTDPEYNYKAVIGYYNNQSKAEKRLRQLLLNGNHVEVKKMDSVNFIVVSELKCKAADTSRAKDSLGALFGYKHVHILQQ